jgi:hypothetical protein
VINLLSLKAVDPSFVFCRISKIVMTDHKL